ncbi:MAG: alginate export family protein [Verrucomicrobiota bacterium]
MKMKSTILASSSLVLAIANQVYAQYAPPPPPAPFPGFINEALRKNDPYMNAWDFGGNNRARYELKEGFGIAGITGSVDFRDHGAGGKPIDTYNEYFTDKLRYHIGYTAKWFSVYGEGRSSFANNDQRWAYSATPTPPGTKNDKGQGPESDTIDLHQAYLTIGNHKEFPVSLKIGRQELSYGDERLVGAFAWNNIGRVFDAAKLRYQNEWFGADVFVSRVVVPHDGEFNYNNDYDNFSGIYATTAKIPKHSLDLYFLARNSQVGALAAEESPQAPQPSPRNIYTVGGRLKSAPGQLGNWDYSLEGAYQFGNFRDLRPGAPTTWLTQDAFMFVAQAGYTFADVWGTPRLGLEYDFGSGDANAKDGKHETFENLFPTNHKFYGYMDFASLQNLHDVRAIFQIKPHPRLSLAVEGHGFWLADATDNFYNVGGGPRGGVGTTGGNGYGINPKFDRFVGSELDIVAGFAMTRFAQLELGVGHFFTGNYVSQSLSGKDFGSKDASYLYVQTSINF